MGRGMAFDIRRARLFCHCAGGARALLSLSLSLSLFIACDISIEDYMRLLGYAEMEFGWKNAQGG